MRKKRETNRLNDLAVRSKGPGKYCDGGGLWLVVDTSGSRRWVLIYRNKGKQREMGLGGYPLVSLSKARELARTAMLQLRVEGIDPIDTRRKLEKLSPNEKIINYIEKNTDIESIDNVIDDVVGTNFIYVIGGTEKPYKIGISNNPKTRLKSLQTGYPFELKIYHIEPIPEDKGRLIEQIIHKTIKHKKTHGEWFDISLEDAIAEVKHARIRYLKDENL